MGGDYSKYISYNELYNLLPSFNNKTEYDKEKINKAIANFKDTLTFLNSKIDYMSQNKIKYTKEAHRLYMSKNKSGALHQLKLKKMYENEIKKIESIQFNIESNILHMESVSVMLETVSTIKNTSSHINLINKDLDLSNIENVIENLCEQKDTSTDIASILSDTSTAEFDETELLQELDNLNEDDLIIENNTPSNNSPSNNSINPSDLPEVPNSKLPSIENNDSISEQKHTINEDDKKSIIKNKQPIAL
tara:strand:- start:12 stop:758 length:747 start_codon:yes stop_codon:yes gene_type:complete